MSSLFDLEALPERAFVDYLIAAESRFGVFATGDSGRSLKRVYMKPCKMGDGPDFAFYWLFHFGPLETVQSVARVILSTTLRSHRQVRVLPKRWRRPSDWWTIAENAGPDRDHRPWDAREPGDGTT